MNRSGTKNGKFKTCNEIRDDFMKFFAQLDHQFVPSSPLLPAEDPTLLFTNAGMNQFKDIFLGSETRDYVRAHNTQKCIRAGGKHNDLEDVGLDVYHHTFFEMLGNWSFGDYFKAEAIQWAWQLLTEVWHLPKDRLHATVFQGSKSEKLEADTEAESFWKELTDINPSHIHRCGKKDNFWEMGATGPCGPCSEIHIDLTEDKSGAKLINAGDPRVMELWNLVFIQYNRDESGKLTPLAATHVDTGLGLERICMVLQGKKSNYATDLFVPIIKQIETFTDHRYGSSGGGRDRFDVVGTNDIADVACRVIADHARALTFAIADGVIPSNEGRGYVLRRILRRAARYGREYLNIDGCFIAELVPTVVELMGKTFGELSDRRQHVIDTIQGEEESFGQTLDRGIGLFAKQADKLSKAGKKQLPGKVVFDLYATYGFPVDLTQIMAGERNMTVDLDGYEKLMAEHKQTSGASSAFTAEQIPQLPPTDESAKYCNDSIDASVLGWLVDGEYVTDGSLQAGVEAAVVLDKTNFYAERGGQVGDTGKLTWSDGEFTVTDTQAVGKGILHVGKVAGSSLKVSQSVRCTVGSARMDIMRHHTATHLLNQALAEVLGPNIDQAGSVVSPERLRFDFRYDKALTNEQIAQVESIVNQRILADEAVSVSTMKLAEAQKIPGVRAVFGEKYPDPVRVVSIGKSDGCGSVEFCGGTHLERVSRAGLFKIVSTESVAKGVRRITALAGPAAVSYVQEMCGIVAEVSTALHVPAGELASRVDSMQQEIKNLKKQGKLTTASPGGDKDLTAQAEMDSPHGKILVIRTDHTDAGAMRKICDVQRQKGAAGIFVAGAAEGKVLLVAMVTDAMVATGLLDANSWVKGVAPIIGGGGGGKPTLAQAGGKKDSDLGKAIQAAVDFASGRISSDGEKSS